MKAIVCTKHGSLDALRCEELEKYTPKDNSEAGAAIATHIVAASLQAMERCCHNMNFLFGFTVTVYRTSAADCQSV